MTKENRTIPITQIILDEEIYPQSQGRSKTRLDVCRKQRLAGWNVVQSQKL